MSSKNEIESTIYERMGLHLAPRSVTVLYTSCMCFPPQWLPECTDVQYLVYHSRPEMSVW